MTSNRAVEGCGATAGLRPTTEVDMAPALGEKDVSELLGLSPDTLRLWHTLSDSGIPRGPRASLVAGELRYGLDDLKQYLQGTLTEGELHRSP